MKCGLSEKPAATMRLGARWPSRPPSTSKMRPKAWVREESAAGFSGFSSVPGGIFTSTWS